jgi:hypothetical protein
MHRRSIVLALPIACFWLLAVHAQPPAVSVSLEGGRLVPSPLENPCPGSTLYINHDYGFHCGYAWQYGGVVPPYYGAFAEQFDGSGTVCGVQFVFTTLPDYYHGQTLDAYAWESQDGIPGAVLGMTPGLQPGTIPIWPDHSVHDFAIAGPEVDGPFFAGMWGNWPGERAAFFLAEDLDGPIEGTPMTNIAPGLGYPTGWYDVAYVWGPTWSMGIGVYLDEGATPVEPVTWGRIKTLFAPHSVAR